MIKEAKAFTQPRKGAELCICEGFMVLAWILLPLAISTRRIIAFVISVEVLKGKGRSRCNSSWCMVLVVVAAATAAGGGGGAAAAAIALNAKPDISHSVSLRSDNGPSTLKPNPPKRQIAHHPNSWGLGFRVQARNIWY